jgi:exopolyphosphatase/guanosine-5'-triphosphate,3'-diphosphate pyrophosphatase
MHPSAHPLQEEVPLLLHRHEVEPEHVQQVARLALSLFDQLRQFHGYGDGERRLLECAALLHDIGWSVSGDDGRGHHKASAKLIREFTWKTLSTPDIRCVAAVARYHRKALPKKDHPDLEGMNPVERTRVSWLAACLRTADGLDRRDSMDLWVSASDSIQEELAAADKKSDLLRSLLPGSLRLFSGMPPS